jgi:hypothetical protein
VSIEALVILRPPADTAHPPALRWTVTGTMPPRLLLVRIEPGELAAARAHAAVAQVVSDRVEASALQTTPPLTAGEALFVSAFAAQGRKSGPRPGEGLDWDSPGFTPPGRPRRR